MPSPRIWSVILAATVLALFATQLQAAGDSFSARENDLQLTADWTWAGCAAGGYYPIRIAMKNFGPSRQFGVEFVPGDSGLPRVTRRVKVDQNATASFSLLVPMVGSTSHGQLVVSYNGEPLERLTRHLTLPDAQLDNLRPGIVVVASEQVDCAALETALTSVLGHSGSGRHGMIRTTDHEVIEPLFLPDSWLAYSGLDLVFISRDRLAALAETERSAILDWARAGGSLFVYEAGETVQTSAEFARLLGLENAGDSETGWSPATFFERRAIQVVEVDQYNNTSTSSGSEADFTWELSPDVFAMRTLGLGRVVGFRDNPFSGSVQDWGWALSAVGASRLRWPERLGVAGRSHNAEFLEFLIPNNRSVPMLAFLIFISVFTFVIGPFNYYVLSRRGRLNFLVVTIPAIAIATSVTLLAFSGVVHGFSVKSRVRSVTLLDQTSQSAVTSTRLALYAGLAPSEGLRFSPSTAVIPVWPQGMEFTSGRVDWSEAQHLPAGWLRSRTRTQFLTVNVRPERGRLTIDPGDAGSINVTNGLEWDLESLVVWQDGEYFYGTGLAAGAAKSLPAGNPDQLQDMLTLLRRSQPAMPADLADDADVDVFSDFNRRRRYGWRSRPEAHFSQGVMEKNVALVASMIEKSKGGMAPSERRWVATLRQPPGVEFGTETTVADGWHLVIGTY